jgi:adenosylcobyric acid synthase
MGSYLHGCFSSDEFRSKFLKSLGVQASALRFEQTIETTLDGLAQHLEAHLDLDRLLTLAGEV